MPAHLHDVAKGSQPAHQQRVLRQEHTQLLGETASQSKLAEAHLACYQYQNIMLATSNQGVHGAYEDMR
jgi:hypothetical protein